MKRFNKLNATGRLRLKSADTVNTKSEVSAIDIRLSRRSDESSSHRLTSKRQKLRSNRSKTS